MLQRPRPWFVGLRHHLLRSQPTLPLSPAPTKMVAVVAMTVGKSVFLPPPSTVRSQFLTRLQPHLDFLPQPRLPPSPPPLPPLPSAMTMSMSPSNWTSFPIILCVLSQNCGVVGSESTAEGTAIHNVLHKYLWHARDGEWRYAGAPCVYDEWNGRHPAMQVGMGMVANQNPAVPASDAANQNPAVPPPDATPLN